MESLIPSPIYSILLTIIFFGLLPYWGGKAPNHKLDELISHHGPPRAALHANQAAHHRL